MKSTSATRARMPHFKVIMRRGHLRITTSSPKLQSPIDWRGSFSVSCMNLILFLTATIPNVIHKTLRTNTFLFSAPLLARKELRHRAASGPLLRARRRP
jgi:hypothetical protein